MNVLGIETSCDETSVAVVDGDGRVLANVIASQMEAHARYGGVVPELAARAHLENLPVAFEEALSEAGKDYELIEFEGAPHSFFDRKQEEFQAASDEAWQRTLDFIAAHS